MKGTSYKNLLSQKITVRNLQMQVNVSVSAFLGEEDVVQLLTLDIVTLHAERDGTFNGNSSP